MHNAFVGLQRPLLHAIRTPPLTVLPVPTYGTRARLMIDDQHGTRTSISTAIKCLFSFRLIVVLLTLGRMARGGYLYVQVFIPVRWVRQTLTRTYAAYF